MVLNNKIYDDGVNNVPENVPDISRNTDSRLNLPNRDNNYADYYKNIKKYCLRYTKKGQSINKSKDIYNYENVQSRCQRDPKLKSYCVLSVCIAFFFGLSLGVLVVSTQNSTKSIANPIELVRKEKVSMRTLNSLRLRSPQIDNKIESTESVENEVYPTVSFMGGKLSNMKHNYEKENIYPKGMTEGMKEILKDNNDRKIQNFKIHRNKTYENNENTILFNNIFWGKQIENALPNGYNDVTDEYWENYTRDTEAIKMEVGCGRMQNRLITFKDGMQACVRYRQNTDQIQGEIFSYYVGKLLNLTNLAPSVVKVVDLRSPTWQSIPNDIAAAQWNTNRAVVLTQYISNLDSAHIPDVFKPSSRHLNKFDIFQIASRENGVLKHNILVDKLKKKKNLPENVSNFEYVEMAINKKNLDIFVELAQWSDLIIFDYLTANLDRIVNNLFNFQWNANIMDGPAHNLAKKIDSGLLVFLDNESGLLHGYRLLKKYNVYHRLMLDNLCVFRKTTIDALKNLYENKNVGKKLNDLFHERNDAVIRDVLPPLPEKNVKILHERIGRVLSQVEKCEQDFSKR